MKSLHNTAILIFANSASEELSKKAMPKGERVFETLTKETLRKVKRTKQPYFHISEKEQTGNSFGERFTNAIQTVFDKGYEHIITVGNDTPQLKTEQLLKTETALAAGKTVLGPSFDGGFYLMGIKKADFDPETFKRLPWQRYNLFNKISEILNEAECELYKLTVLGDIDSLEDAKRFVSFTKSISSTLLQLLTLLIQIENATTNILVPLFSAVSLQQPSNKGSPVLLHS